MLPSSSQMARTRRAPGRWIRRAGGPLCLSICAHAALAVTAGTYLKLRQPTPAAQAVAMDVDVVELPGVPAAAAPASAPPSREPSHATPRRSSSVSRSPTERAVIAATAATDSKIERFVLVAGTIGAQAPTAAVSLTDGVGVGGDAVGEGDVDVPARLVSTSPLVYPAAARQAELEIDLSIEIVVDAGGRVVSARVLRRAGYGLDEAALRAIETYRFSPARRRGRAVPVRMRWTVQFRLR